MTPSHWLNYQSSSLVFILEQFHKVFINLICTMCLVMTLLRSLLHLPGTNKLMKPVTWLVAESLLSGCVCVFVCLCVCVFGYTYDHSFWETFYAFSNGSQRLKIRAISLAQDLSNSSLNSLMVTKWCTKLYIAWKRCLIVFSCDQAALWMVFSVRLSVTLFHYVPIIASSWNFQELLPMTKVRSMQKVKVNGHGHRGQTQLNYFLIVTPVLIHIWWWNGTKLDVA